MYLKSFYKKNIWSQRFTIKALVYREINQRYKQSALGWLWALVRPLLIAGVFTFLFGNVSKLNYENTPYPLVVFGGLLPWELFSNVLIKSTSSLLRYKKLITNLSTPKYLFPLVAAFSCLFEFIILFIITLSIFIGYQFPISKTILLYPFLALFVLLAGLSIGFWLTTFTIWFRDIKFAIGNLLQIMMLITPVGYSTVSIPENYKFICNINPLTVIMNTSRYLLLGSNRPSNESMFYSSLFFIILITTGFLFFNAKKYKFADIM